MRTATRKRATPVDSLTVAAHGFEGTIHLTRVSTSKAENYPPSFALGAGAPVTQGKPAAPMPAGVIPGLQRDAEREFFLTPGIVPGANGILVLRRADDGAWTAKLSKTLMPAVLSKDADPPIGFSALPPTLERVVPEGFRYWQAPDAITARKIRDALIEKNFFDESLLRVVDGEIRLCAQKLYLYEPDEHAPAQKSERPSRDAVIKSLVVVSDAMDAVVVAPDATSRSIADALSKTDSIALISPDSMPALEAAIDEIVLTRKASEVVGAAWLIATEDTAEARKEIERVAPAFKIDAAGADDFVFATSFDPGPVAQWVRSPDVMDAVLATFDRAYAASAPAPTAKAGAEDAKGEIGGEVGDHVKRVTSYMGIPVWIDRPKGFVQQGTAPDGATWSRTYTTDYGFIPGAAGGDGEDLDVFIGPEASAPIAFWIEQKHKDGTFDEFKVFLGYASEGDALKTYAEHIPADLAGTCTAIPIDTMRALLGIPPRDIVDTAKRANELRGTSIKLAKADAAPTNAEHYVLGIVLEPDVVDTQKDTYSAEEIRSTAHKWMEDYRAIGLMHRGDVSTSVRPVESYIAPVDFELGGQTVKAGTWLLAVHVIDHALWEAVKAGELTGFSIGGSAIRKPDPEATAKHLAQHKNGG